MGVPFIIGVGGAGSSSGKTTFASALIRALVRERHNAEDESYQSSASLKFILSDKKNWGAIKYTRTEFYSSITDTPEILNEPEKDTRRFLEAGAQEVLWVQSPPENLDEVMPLAIERLSYLDGIIIEGNSAIEFAKPNIIVFVSAKDNGEIKQSARGILSKADIVIMSRKSPLTGYSCIPDNCKVFKTQDFFNSHNNYIIIEEVILYMDKSASQKMAAELLGERSDRSAISCSEARKIAEETGLPYSDIGKLADELKIKIKNCELGCF